MMRIVKTKNRGDLIWSVMHQNYDFFLDAKLGNKNVLNAVKIPIIWPFTHSEYNFDDSFKLLYINQIHFII